MQKIRVLIIDDSIVMQNLLAQLLAYDNAIEVIGMASNPLIARELIKELNPHVLLLDIEMPHMNGLTFLRNLMRLRPMPVIMVSSYTGPGKALTLEALAIGATDCIAKPSADELADIKKYAERLIASIKNAAQINIEAIKLLTEKPSSLLVDKTTTSNEEDSFLKDTIIAIGASTGGIEAIERILSYLPVPTPGIVIVQHIRKDFTKLFAERVNRLSQLTVMLASQGQRVLPGHALLAPYDSHLMIQKNSEDYSCVMSKQEPVHGHRPSVDILFNSLAKLPNTNVIGILLTGMGKDGAQGLATICQSGGITIAQDQNSSVVWGMPGAAVQLGAAQYVKSLNDIVYYLNKRIYLQAKQ